MTTEEQFIENIGFMCFGIVIGSLLELMDAFNGLGIVIGVAGVVGMRIIIGYISNKAKINKKLKRKNDDTPK